MELTVIIPSFNTKELLFNCLKSVFEETKKIKFEVIVVDNASIDGSPENIRLFAKKYSCKFVSSPGKISKKENASGEPIRKNSHTPTIKLIQNRTNLGYAKANNQGIKKAKGEYLLFLNSDTVILNRAIEKCLEFMKKKKDVDILGCQLLNADKSIQASGGFFPDLNRIFYQMFFIDDLPIIRRLIKPYQQARKDFYKKIQLLDWATGAFLLVKKSVINKIKGFDESFFMYSEEVDFCYRAKKAGFKTCFYSKARIIHLKGKSSPEGFKSAVLGEYKGLKKFYKKHKPAWQTLILKLLLKAGAVLRIFLFGILKRDKSKKEIYEKAFKLA